MSVTHFEKRSGRKDNERTVLKAETISDYFSPDRAHREVKRGELGSILARYEDARQKRVWWRRIVRRARSFFELQRKQQHATDAAIAEGVSQGSVKLERPKAGE